MQENQQSQQPETEAQKAKRLRSEHDAALIAAREAAGKAGKLWRVTVHYELDNESKAHYIDNRYFEETVEIRERLFSAGLMVPYDPGTWLILPPHELKAIFVTKQSKYFDL